MEFVINVNGTGYVLDLSREGECCVVSACCTLALC